MSWFSEWPGWAGRLVWSLVTIGAVFATGYVLEVLLESRLRRLTARTDGEWDDTLIAEVRRRVPFWSLLAGVYLALPYWSLDAAGYTKVVKVLSAIAVGSLTVMTAAVAARVVSWRGPRTTPAAPVSALTQNVVKTTIMVLGALVIIQLFVPIAPYLTALGVGGLAVALAVQDPLSNFFAGIFMSASGQVRLGQYIKLDGGAEGYVADVNWRATSIRTLTNNVVIVPNVKLAQAAVTNFDHPSRDLAVVVEAGVYYRSDLAAVERVTREVAVAVMAEVAGGVKDFEPTVRFHTFGPTAINFSVTMRGRTVTDQSVIKHEFIKRLHVRYADERIVMPFAGLAPEALAPLTGKAE